MVRLVECLHGKLRAVRRGHDQEGKVTTVLMHRQILGLLKGDRRTGDHADGDTLNNTNDNLRIASAAQNTQNQGLRSSNTSGFKGVSRFRNQVY